VTELQASLTDGRVVKYREEVCRVRHYYVVKKGLVGIEELNQEDVTLEVSGLLTQLL
jgi:hypothetical protein